MRCRPPRPPPEAGALRREGLRDPALVFFLAAVVPVCIVFFQHESSMSVFLVRDVGLAVWVFGLLHTVNTLLIVFLEVPLNLATAHWTHRRTLVLGSVLVAAGFGALAWARSLPAVVATVVVWTFGEMILVPSMSSWVADVAPPDKRGAYMGLYTMAFSLALVVGAPFGTSLLEHGGGRTLWLTMLALGLLSAALFTRVKEPPREKAMTETWTHREGVVNGIRLHWVEQGEGPLVVLLHGFPEFWYAWRHQIPALAAAGFRAVAPDLRGYNLSEKPRRRARRTASRRSSGTSPASSRGSARRRATHAPTSSATTGAAPSPGTRRSFLPEKLLSLSLLNAPHPLAFRARAPEERVPAAPVGVRLLLPAPAAPGAADRAATTSRSSGRCSGAIP